jgi:hypothetical protein
MALGTFTPAHAADVICYKCPPQWADFATMFKSIKADFGYDLPSTTRTSARHCRSSSPKKPTRSPTGRTRFRGHRTAAIGRRGSSKRPSP